MPSVSAIGDFRSCCRLCLSEKTDTMKSIFDENSPSLSLQEKILAFVNVKISTDDKLTTSICMQCATIVNTWQIFKKSCIDNQEKLNDWMESWVEHQELANTSICIKHEPRDEVRVQNRSFTDDDQDQEQDSDIDISELSVKEENTERNDADSLTPPQLEPYDAGVQEANNENSQTQESLGTPSRTCSVCSKVFSSISNCRKHQRVMHGKKSTTEDNEESVSQDEQSQNSADSQNSIDKEITTPSQELSKSDAQKIQFAAGLKLFQNSTPPISQENLSKIELSYMEKCKAMVTMYKSLECACHNVTHPTLKGLLSHLRALRIWFPVYTCYNCMITYTDRSSSYRHNARCPNSSLETLIKLSNLKKRSEVKTRLYQNYKCTHCKYMFSFYEDFTKHIDEDHIPEEGPFNCVCKKVFSGVDDFKSHIYTSCFIEYYCDICFITTSTLEEFQKHASDVHDNSEGFILLQDDNYKKRRPNISPEKFPEENIITTKRKSTFYKNNCKEEEVDEGSPAPKVKSIVPARTNTCPVCFKEYSCYANVVRHFKTHTEDEMKSIQQNDEALFCCPDCGGMYAAHEWPDHKASHERKSCNECGKVFQFQSELDQHRSVHLNLKVYRDSKTQSYKSTMLSPNSEINLVMCDICESIFTSPEELVEHRLTHVKREDEVKIEGKKYECKPCNKQYSGHSGLYDHNRKKHPDLAAPSNWPKKCPECDKILYTGGSYQLHKQMHERVGQAMLEQAARSAKPSAPARQTAIATRHSKQKKSTNDEDESYHTCKKCFKVFSSKYNLKNHMKCHGINLSSKAGAKSKSPKKVWCDTCHESCENADALKKHKQEEHSSQQEPKVEPMFELKSPFIFTCDVCTLTFNTKAALKKHKDKHAREDIPVVKKNVYVYCKYCKIPFANVDLLNKHMDSEHDEEMRKPKPPPVKTKQYACSVCKKAFISSAALHAHQGWHKRGKVERQIKTQEKLFRKMVNNYSPTQKPNQQIFQCSTCSTKLPNNTALQIHILEKHRNVETVVLGPRCQPCNQEFKTKEEFERHRHLHEVVEKRQTNDKPAKKFLKNFPCNYCPAAFSRSDTLNAHMRNIHREHIQTEFRCLQCDRTFDKQNSLSIHLKVHEKQKLNHVSPTKQAIFSCSICNMGFDLPRDLRVHTITAHPF